jgi:signal transduction histidine kinase
VLFTPVRTSRAVAVATAAVATALALAGALTDGWRNGLYVLLNLGLLLAVPVVWAHEVRGHRERADAERDRAEAVARVAELDRAAAVTAERTRMARDLHDVVAGRLSAIALQSEAALARPDADPDLLRRVLGEVRRGSVASLAEMRTMIGLLRADAPDEPRTAPAGLDGLGPLLESARASGVRVELDDRRAAAPVSAAVDLAAHRILAEALTNAAKHAPGSTVRCVLADGDGALRVEVVNDLVPGATPGPGTRTGLLGLGERAAAVGGRLDAGPEDGRWTVRASLPGSA